MTHPRNRAKYLRKKAKAGKLSVDEKRWLADYKSPGSGPPSPPSGKVAATPAPDVPHGGPEPISVPDPDAPPPPAPESPQTEIPKARRVEPDPNGAGYMLAMSLVEGSKAVNAQIRSEGGFALPDAFYDKVMMRCATALCAKYVGDEEMGDTGNGLVCAIGAGVPLMQHYRKLKKKGPTPVAAAAPVVDTGCLYCGSAEHVASNCPHKTVTPPAPNGNGAADAFLKSNAAAFGKVTG